MAKRHVTRRKAARSTTGKPARSAKTTRRTKSRPLGQAAPPPQAAAGPVRPAEPSRREGARSVPRELSRAHDRGFRSSRGLAAPPTARALTPSARRLARQVKDLEVHYDQTTQVPNMIIARAARAMRRSVRLADPGKRRHRLHPAARRSLAALEGRYGDDRSGVGQPASQACPPTPRRRRVAGNPRSAADSASAT